MLLSVATATLFMNPFEQALEMIAEAGFQNIELDLYWERKEWAMAQHLKDVPVKRAVQLVEQAGLKITSIHDGGGVLENEHSALGYINPALDRYLDEMGYAPECIVFHTPHIEGERDKGWWKKISIQIVNSLAKYRQACTWVTLENCPFFDGYSIPMTQPDELKAFAIENGLGITVDTTHFAEIGIDVTEAVEKMGENVKTIHLSDFAEGRRHAFIGDGRLDLSSFLDAIDRQGIKTITLECSLSSSGKQQQEMGHRELVDRMVEARKRLYRILGRP